MNKVQVRCYLAQVWTEHNENITVYYTLPDFGYYTELYTDLRTGEIYARKVGDNSLSFKNIDDIVTDELCPITGKPLKGYLTRYPQSFLCGREIGHFEPEGRMPPDDDSIVKTFWEL